MRGRLEAAACASVVVCGILAGTVLMAPLPAFATPNLANASVALTTVATGLTKPTDIAWRHGDSRMYVTQQTGSVRIVAANGTLVATPVLTVSVSGGNEQGLLGLAFSSDGTKLYVDYTDPSGNIHVDEYTMNGDVADTSTKRQLLLQNHTQFANHNGGEVVFGPDGMLYIGIGDGGSGGDPNGNGQNLGTWLGKILRINPNQNGANPYSVPADNPFVGQSGKLPEIWMYGLRNPWRFSFDRSTGDTWIGDVGQDLYEEVDTAAAGQSGINWGWNLREGLHPYNGGAEPPGARDPLFELPHSAGYCAVIGGYVYRGSAIADLGGSYLYGDSCRSEISAVSVSGGQVTLQRDLGITVDNLTTFAEDPNGEIFAASRTGTIYELVQGTVASATNTVSVGDGSVVEGDTGTRSVTFPVTLAHAATGSPVSVAYSVSSATATGAASSGSGVDFRTAAGTLTFTPTKASGESPILKYVTVPVYGDTTDEGDETFTVTLSSPSSGLTIGDGSGTGTIIDDDPGSGLRVGVGDASVVEGDNGTRTVQVPVTVSGSPGATTVSVPYTIGGGNATWSKTQAGGGDFGGAKAGTLTFTGSAVSRTLSIPVYGDQLAEANETVHVTLGSVTGGSSVRSVGTVTILDDDAGSIVTPPAPTMSVGDVSVVEGDSGTRSLTFPVSLSQAATVPVSANYSVSGVTATGSTKPGPGVDFRAAAGTLTFTPANASGESPVLKYVTVPVYSDTTTEGNETFTVTLSNVAGGAFVPGDTTATGTIIDDDPGGGLGVGVGDASVVEGTSGSRVVKIPVTVSAQPGSTSVSVPYTIVGADATWSKTQAGGGDFGGTQTGTLTFTGSTVSKMLSITVYGDRAVEGDETVQITLGAITGAIAVRSVGTLTILDDD